MRFFLFPTDNEIIVKWKSHFPLQETNDDALEHIHIMYLQGNEVSLSRSLLSPSSHSIPAPTPPLQENSTEWLKFSPSTILLILFGIYFYLFMIFLLFHFLFFFNHYFFLFSTLPFLGNENLSLLAIKILITVCVLFLFLEEKSE